MVGGKGYKEELMCVGLSANAYAFHSRRAITRIHVGTKSQSQTLTVFPPSGFGAPATPSRVFLVLVFQDVRGGIRPMTQAY